MKFELEQMHETIIKLKQDNELLTEGNDELNS